ncbi:MAG: hypothetical protein E7392_04535 [Ruminococcaceae bacterium]|nr:hypothetical protein [Oscillospiraceae bacterium]
MRKLLYLIITFIVCYILKLQDIWVVFVPVMLLLIKFKFNAAALWEIPLCCLALGVLETAFGDDMVTLLRILIPCSGAIIGLFSPKKLFVFFLAAAYGVIVKNMSGVCVIWAVLWSVARLFFINSYSTTKVTDLQEYKL